MYYQSYPSRYYIYLQWSFVAFILKIGRLWMFFPFANIFEVQLSAILPPKIGVQQIIILIMYVILVLLGELPIHPLFMTRFQNYMSSIKTQQNQIDRTQSFLPVTKITRYPDFFTFTTTIYRTTMIKYCYLAVIIEHNEITTLSITTFYHLAH